MAYDCVLILYILINSKAKIDLTVDNYLDGCLLVVDESEQVLNHLLHADTKYLRKKRAEIMTQLKIVKTLQKFIWLTLTYLIFPFSFL